MMLQRVETTPFSSVLIGNESLLIGCGDALLDQGHDINAVITDAAEIRDWAQAKGLMTATLNDGLVTTLTAHPFDWLLSIANLKIIPDAILALPRRGAVNFHDGPLPRYAGVNAPVWALIHGEPQHGVTWHMIENGVDEGDIVAQRLFDIAPDDTAFSLNSRCYAEALESFGDVIQALASDAPDRKAQDLSQRSYYARNARPSADGRLDFTASATELAALVRGLDHGDYWNPLSSAKIAVNGGRLLVVGKANPGGPTDARPGLVIEMGPDWADIATTNGMLRLSEFRATTGNQIVLANVMAVGQQLASPTAAESAAIDAVKMRLIKAEADWRAHLAQMNAAELPLARGAVTMRNLQARQVATPALTMDRFVTGVAIWAACNMGAKRADIAFCDADAIQLAAAAPGHVRPWVPLGCDASETLGDMVATLAAQIKRAKACPGLSSDLFARDPALSGTKMPKIAVAIGATTLLPGSDITLVPGAQIDIFYDAARFDEATITLLCDRLATVLGTVADPQSDALAPAEITGISDSEMRQILIDWNATGKDYDRTQTIHEAIADQARTTPNDTALVFENNPLSYADLDARANQLAHVLIDMGVGAGMPVGLCLNRSAEMVIAALAILKAGGAYLPLDPAYPQDRLDHYLTDSQASVVVTTSVLAGELPDTGAIALLLDTDARVADAHRTAPASRSTASDLAYLIYTSGSTGTPKGVMVTHRNVVNFFAGMDDRIGGTPGTWLSVTSLAFDISVLELFYTLARGYKIVLSGDETRALVSQAPAITSDRPIDFSLFYWGNDDGQGPRKYELLLEGAKFADANGFNAVWTPERHFHAFGGPYPNPSVTGAAVAAVTNNIAVRAGSCVAPLHHPARIAEEWAVIDNLTNGRAGMGIASGWQPDDFVLRPENRPPNNKPAMFEAIDTLRKLWRGEEVAFDDGNGGTHAVITQPRPVSQELDLWVTTAGNPDTWREAGQIGANILTHLLGQSIEEVGEKIALYHDALRAAGHDPADHTVTLMLHTYVGADREEVRERARGPMKDYLRSAAGLIKQFAWAFPAFKRPEGASNAFDVDLGTLDDSEMDAILDFAFQRYFDESGLFGTVQDCLARVEDLKQIGVDEVACLIDYGIAPELVMEGLKPLADVLRRANIVGKLDEDDFSIAAQIERHDVTHLQCTPSMARMIAMNDEARAALANIQHLMVGGEALPADLARDLAQATQAQITNMYGPTETTIWSTTDPVGQGDVTIGTPIANTQIYVLDNDLRPVPVGVAGELYIAGEGVTAGYWQRAALTQDRFLPDPMADSDTAQMYRTGDQVAWRMDGRLDYLGRGDQQLKIRGHRIELGEIEAVLATLPGVSGAVVLAQELSANDLRLTGYYVADSAIDNSTLRDALAQSLPSHMIPAQFMVVDAFPLTPNKKIDRKALGQMQAPVAAMPVAAPIAQTTTPVTEVQVAAIWTAILGTPEIKSNDSFFALGGHSLLAVQAHRELRQHFADARLSVTDIFAKPTLGALAAHIDARLARAGGAASPTPSLTPTAPATDRAAAMSQRRALRARREMEHG